MSLFVGLLVFFFLFFCLSPFFLFIPLFSLLYVC